MNYYRTSLRAIAVIVVTGLLFSAAIAQQGTWLGKPIIEGTWRGEPAQFVAGEILVKFQDSDVRASEYAQRIGGQVTRGVEPDGFAIIEVDQSADVPALCEELYSDPMVKWAEPNFIQTITDWVPNDQYYPDSTWSLKNTGQNPPDGIPDADINADWAWDYTHGNSNVVLAILDTGIDMDSITSTLRHYDLNESGKMILGLDAVGDGYGVADLHGHGTHVAGIAAAETDNTWGIAGVAEYCKVLVIQVFDRYGSATSTSVGDGIEYAVDYQIANPSCRVVMNYSGRGWTYSAHTYDKLVYAETNDVPFVTAAGNDYASSCPYPCFHSGELDNVICVGATDPWDQKSGYSNHCANVNIVAPGGFGSPYSPDDVYSCLPINTYGYKAGTSMSAPHVTGICGLVCALNMSISALDLRNLLEETADDEVGTLADDPLGFNTKHGWGRANAWSAIMHSPLYITPYVRQNQRFSNAFSSVGEYISYRMAPPPNWNWEIAAVRPGDGIDADVILRNPTGVNLITSSCDSDTVDFIVVRNRPLSGSDYYARIINSSGSGKYCAEYEQAEQSFIGSMFIDNYEWESAHVVQLYEIYLQNGHRYLFSASVGSGELDVGLALVGPSEIGTTYFNRSDAEFIRDTNGSGTTEYLYHTMTGDDGWYALVVFSNNGRNGVMDIQVVERITTDSPIALSESDGVSVVEGYYYTAYTTRNTMGVMGFLPIAGNNYSLALYNSSSFSGTPLISSNYTTGYADFFLWDQTVVTGQKYPYVDYSVLNPGNTGYVMYKDDTDDYLSIGTNGPYTFDDGNIMKAWDVNMTNGTQYHFTADIISGSLDIGIGLFKKNATYKARSSYFRYDYTGGAGVDEYIEWDCDSSGYYTLVAWSRNGVTGDFNIIFEDYPNLITTLLTGWDYEIVPRSSSGATFSNCPITLTLPGNTNNTYFNLSGRNDSPNIVPVTPFYNQIYLDGDYFYQRTWSSGVGAHVGFASMNFLSTSTIKGGKHTLELRLDGTDVIDETDETDNDVAHQFIWSPYVLTNDVQVTRTAPPLYSSQWSQPNCDGFQYSRTGGYAYAVAMCPVSDDNYELRLYDDYTGSEVGFDSLRAYSSYVSGYTEYGVATYTGVQSTAYIGVHQQMSENGTGNFYIHAIDATDRILNTTDEVRQDTLESYKIIKVYEVHLESGTEYSITTEGVSGAADVNLYLYGPDYGYYGRGDYVAASYNVGTMNEEIVYTPTTTAYHVITVFKPNYLTLSDQGVYELSVGLSPPNLVTTVPTGWDYECVPRNTSGAAWDNCHITATLPGNTADTYLNFSGRNNSSTAIPDTFCNQLYLDGSYFFERPWSSLPLTGNTTFYHLNWMTTTPIRGGKHTIELRLDGNDDIVESNETDNNAANQYIWSPYILTNNVPVTRDIPPPMTFVWPQPNCDGFQYTRTGSYAYVVAECPLIMADDHNLRLYDDYTGSEEGFDSLRVLSGMGDGEIEYAVATYTNVASTVYPGVYDYDTDGTDGFAIHAIDSRDRIIDASVGEMVIDTLSDYQLVKVFESNLISGYEYVIDLFCHIGTADMDLAMFGPDNGYYSRNQYLMHSATAGDPDERIIFTPSQTAYYVFVVYRPNANAIPAYNRFHFTIGRNEVNLTYATPTGWDYPAVPRNIPGATTTNCTLTDTLPGNTADTYFNISSYNEGPGPAVDFYFYDAFIDSVEHTGVIDGWPHVPYEFHTLLNHQPSTIVRGGRHTLGLFVDRQNHIVETDETDNWWSHQFVWTPYVLSDYVPVVREAPPRYGSGLYPNCDGFEFTTDYWCAVGMIPFDGTENFNLSLFAPWVDSETGFDIQLEGAGQAVGLCDVVITNDLDNGNETYNVGVKQSTIGHGTDSLVIQQANQQWTWSSPGTFGPFTIDAGEVMGLWEVYLYTPGLYTFEVDVISGGANIATAIYSGEDSTYTRSEYFPDGYSNSSPGSGDESFTIDNPFSGMYFGWGVWKYSSTSLNLSSTFYLTWGPAGAGVPLPVDDLVIERIGATTARLTWSQVTEDTSGSPLAVDYYRIHRNLDPNFIPSPADSIGYTAAPDTTYDDVNVIWNYDKYFYQVIAVDTDGVVALQPGGEETRRIITGRPPRADAPEAVRERQRR